MGVDKKKSDKVIKSTVSIHDRTQVETVFSYALPVDENKRRFFFRNHPKYRVDAFLFFPVQTGINQSTYTRQQFYNDLRAFIRLREPRLSFRELMGTSKNASSQSSPLVYMRDFVKNSQGKSDVGPVTVALEESRVFGCAYVSYFWRRVERRVRRIQYLSEALQRSESQDQPATTQRFVENTMKFFDKGYALLKAWRDVYNDACLLKGPHVPNLCSEIELVNEYCSYCFRDGLLKVLKTLDDLQFCFDVQALKPLRSRILAYLRLEKWYARKHGFVWVYDDGDKILKETYVYRRGALKRRIWSVLYLNPRADLIFQFQKQLGPMIAAGLAGGWALFATLLIWTQSQFRGYQMINALSLSSMVMIVAAFVLAYVAKDRIKELGRSWFEKGVFRSRPDLSNNVYYSQASGERRKIATLSELVHFIKQDKIPADIKNLRRANVHRYHKFEDAAGAVIRYSKIIEIIPESFKDLHLPIAAVHDIVRLNISSYISRLDDPLHIGLTPTRDGRAVETLMPKVYHIDFILKYSSLRRRKEENQSVIDYFRLVVDKKGLSRIEQLK